MTVENTDDSLSARQVFVLKHLFIMISQLMLEFLQIV